MTVRFARFWGAILTGAPLLACGGAAVPPSAPPETTTTVAVATASLQTTTEPHAEIAAVHEDLPMAVLRHTRTLADESTPEGRLYLAGTEPLMRHPKGDVVEARKQLFVLIKDHPQSSLIPYAYLMFAELFFDEAAQDPSKYDLAAMAYDKAAQYPAPGNQTYAYAQYKRALIDTFRNDDAVAMIHSMNALKTIDSTPKGSAEERLNSQVAVSAENSWVASYAKIGDVKKARDLFRTTTPARAPRLSVALGEEYLRRGNVPDAVTAVNSVLVVGVDGATCSAAKEFAKNLPASSPREVTEVTARLRAVCP